MASISTSPWPRPSCTPTSGRRPISPGTTDLGSPTRGTTRSSCRRRHPGRVHGRPDRALPEVAAALTDVPVPYTESRDEALRILADLCAQVPDFPTLEARFEQFGFLVAEVRTVQELAETPWARERDVFVEVEPGARVTGAPFRSDGATIGVRGPGAPLRRAHPRGARRALRADRGRPRPARSRRHHPVGLSRRAQVQPYRLASTQPAPVPARRTLRLDEDAPVEPVLGLLARVGQVEADAGRDGVELHVERRTVLGFEAHAR